VVDIGTPVGRPRDWTTWLVVALVLLLTVVAFVLLVSMYFPTP